MEDPGWRGRACVLCRSLDGIHAVGAEPPVAELPETVAVLGENQGCPGWCVLILREHIEHLGALPIDRQARVFTEVARVAGAIRSVFRGSGLGGGPPRINYESLGNQVPHVHWHVIPRHADDPDPTRPVWGWPADRLRGTMTRDDRLTLARRLAEAIRA